MISLPTSLVRDALGCAQRLRRYEEAGEARDAAPDTYRVIEELRTALETEESQ